MSLTRKCDACGDPIKQTRHLELMMRILETDGPETQFGEEHLGDYCDPCVLSGSAVRDLLLGFPEYLLKCDGNHPMPRCGDPGCWQQ